jgi:hypothetical protein
MEQNAYLSEHFCDFMVMEDETSEIIKAFHYMP